MKGPFPSPSILYHGKSYFIYSTFLSLASLELIEIEDQAGSKILHLGVGFQLPMWSKTYVLFQPCVLEQHGQRKKLWINQRLFSVNLKFL